MNFTMFFHLGTDFWCLFFPFFPFWLLLSCFLFLPLEGCAMVLDLDWKSSCSRCSCCYEGVHVVDKDQEGSEWDHKDDEDENNQSNKNYKSSTNRERKRSNESNKSSKQKKTTKARKGNKNKIKLQTKNCPLFDFRISSVEKRRASWNLQQFFFRNDGVVKIATWWLRQRNWHLGQPSICSILPLTAGGRLKRARNSASCSSRTSNNAYKKHNSIYKLHIIV